MREHEQFGRAPNLRPRTVGATRSGAQAARVLPGASSAPQTPLEELARIANESNQESMLKVQSSVGLEMLSNDVE